MTPPRQRREQAEAQGRRGERLAAWFLMLKGWRIIARRVRVAGGEVDLIARRGRTLAFVEVKWRASVEGRDWALDPYRLRRVEAAAQALASHKPPAYFMDFETIQFAVPIWKGTRPYQQIPFQFSVHRLSRTGKLEQQAFVDLSGKDPSKAFAEALLAACGERGPIFVYNAGFETARIRDLAARFPRLAKALLALNERVVDLLPVAREYYYQPSQQGSWSIKAVLPTFCPDLNYGDLDGVQDGGMAMEAFLEALSPQTGAARKVEIERQLLDYCALDTYAMVRLWSAFTGKAVS